MVGLVVIFSITVPWIAYGAAHAVESSRASSGAFVSSPLSETFFSPSITLKPGQVFRDNIKLTFPEGRIGITGFAADLVFDGGKNDGLPVPLSHTYLHHWTVQQRHHHNAGFCDYRVHPDMTLSYMFGVGSESRKTAISLPFPYFIEADDANNVWFVDLHAIDLRNTRDPLACRECLCSELGQKGTESYIGGLDCCNDQDRCLITENGEALRYKLRYNLSWIENPHSLQNMKPVDVYVMDVTGNFNRTAEDKCLIEYDVPKAQTQAYYRNSSFVFPHGGKVVAAVPHLHSGGKYAAVTRQSSGEEVCVGSAVYGNSTEAGNEQGFVVGITQCRESWNVSRGEVFELTVVYDSNGPSLPLKQTAHVGVMGYVWMAVSHEWAK